MKNLNLACNNIKTIRLKHEDFFNLEVIISISSKFKLIVLKIVFFIKSLDLSFNNLTPIDVAHLGILRNLKFLKLTGNNLEFLPDTFSKLYVHTKELVFCLYPIVRYFLLIYLHNSYFSNKKMVSEKFPNLEELYLDNNKLKEEDSFDVLSVLKK